MEHLDNILELPGQALLNLPEKILNENSAYGFSLLSKQLTIYGTSTAENMFCTQPSHPVSVHLIKILLVLAADNVLPPAAVI